MRGLLDGSANFVIFAAVIYSAAVSVAIYAFWTFLSEAAGAIAIVLGRLDDDDRLRTGEEIRRRVEAYAGPNGVELDGVSLVVSAT